MSGQATLNGSLAVKLQRRTSGKAPWAGLDLSETGEMPMDVGFSPMNGTNFSIPLPTSCDCIKEDIDGTQYLQSILGG